jgi:hypothetical protein
MIETFSGVRIRCSCGNTLYEGPVDTRDRRRVLTRTQFRVAHAVARLFGHDWATGTNADEILRLSHDRYPSLDGVPLWVIAESVHHSWVAYPHQGWQHGRLGPNVVDHDGDLVVDEMTGSGLIRWTVDRDGTLRVRFGRVKAAIIWAPKGGLHVEASDATPGRDPNGPDTLPEWEWWDRIMDLCVKGLV